MKNKLALLILFTLTYINYGCFKDVIVKEIVEEDIMDDDLTGKDTIDNGGTDNGGTDNGGTDNGGTDNGGTDNGGTDNGGTDNGGTDNGGTDNGGTDNGGTDNGGTDNGGTDNGGTDNGVIDNPDTDNEVINLNSKYLVGYWHNWSGGDGYKGGKAPGMRLIDIDNAYNVICVSFMKVYDVSNRIPTFIPDKGIYPNEQDFIEDIKKLNEQGRAVIISLGGADAHIELQTGDAGALANEIIRLSNKYGFDGLDIDLEQAAITAGANQTEIVKALKIVKDKYREENANFLIGMAPEFPYLSVQNSKYKAYIEGLEGYYDWIAPQYYNQGGDGVYIEGVGWIAQNNDAMKEDFLYYLTRSILRGENGYLGLNIPSDKFLIGIPANIDAAATGYIINPNDMKNAYNRLKQDGLEIRGIMTWSINWDIGKNSAGQSYGSKFANDYGPWLAGM